MSLLSSPRVRLSTTRPTDQSGQGRLWTAVSSLASNRERCRQGFGRPEKPLIIITITLSVPAPDDRASSASINQKKNGKKSGTRKKKYWRIQRAQQCYEFIRHDDDFSGSGLYGWKKRWKKENIYLQTHSDRTLRNCIWQTCSRTVGSYYY